VFAWAFLGAQGAIAINTRFAVNTDLGILGTKKLIDVLTFPVVLGFDLIAGEAHNINIE
jgi:hypothetical protein